MGTAAADHHPSLNNLGGGGGEGEERDLSRSRQWEALANEAKQLPEQSSVMERVKSQPWIESLTVGEESAHGLLDVVRGRCDRIAQMNDVPLCQIMNDACPRVELCCGPASMIPSSDWSHAVRKHDSNMLGSKEVYSGYDWS